MTLKWLHTLILDTLILTALSKHKQKLTILSLNIDSLNSKIDDLKLLLADLEKGGDAIGIICITEAWIREDSDTSHLHIENYNLITQSFNQTLLYKRRPSYIHPAESSNKKHPAHQHVEHMGRNINRHYRG